MDGGGGGVAGVGGGEPGATRNAKRARRCRQSAVGIALCGAVDEEWTLQVHVEGLESTRMDEGRVIDDDESFRVGGGLNA